MRKLKIASPVPVNSPDTAAVPGGNLPAADTLNTCALYKMPGSCRIYLASAASGVTVLQIGLVDNCLPSAAAPASPVVFSVPPSVVGE